MGAAVSLKFDTSRWDKALAELGPANFKKACVRALNRTGKNAKTAMVRVVATDMGLPQKAVRDRIFIKEASPASLSVVLSASAKRIPLIDFKARASKRNGVTAKLPKGAGRYPDAFIATMATGHRGVFERNTVIRSRAGLRRGSPALGIHEKFGPSVAQAFDSNVQVAQDRAMEMVQTNMAAEVNYLLLKAKQSA